ncbi:MAG: lasso peptide biosynthesis B2 protein [Gemmatimonas sp.]
MRLIRRLLALSFGDWRDHLAAQRALVRAEWRMRRRPIGGLLNQWTSPAPLLYEANSDEKDRARELGAAVRRVAMYGVPRSQCLARSLAICELLEAHGIRGARVRLGVQPTDASISAHAWVELQGAIIGDTVEHVATFHPLAKASGGAER